MTISEQHLVDEILRRDFLSFLHRCVQTLNPGMPYLDNWHLHAIAYRLDQVRAGQVTRLIINLPPRHLKSTMVSVALPAFLLGHDPRQRIFCISYGMDLAEKHAADFRSIVESSWYRRAFPNMRIKRVADSNVFTTMSGYRRASSTGASITGLGGNIFIIDDPQKPADAQSETLRNETNQWFSNTLLSRLDNKSTGVIILVTQRLHLNDLTGHVIEQGGEWTVLSLPAIAEADQQIPIGEGRLHHRHAGEALHPEHESIEILERLRREVGSDIFQAQYQQAPVPPGGAMIKREWLRYYTTLPERNYRTKVIQSWDTVAKAGAQNDWSVCTTWLIADKHFYLIDLVRGRYEYPRLKETAIALAQRHQPNTILIEEASTGTALASELRKAVSCPVRPIPVERDKVGRLYLQQEKFEAGRVLFPKSASFLQELEAELLTFPQSRTDDQVDSISQALAYKPVGSQHIGWT
jgi:predicted phage terminase large subunit-like protein